MRTDLPGTAEALEFAGAQQERDAETAGAILDRITADKAAVAAVLVGLVELARYAAGGDLAWILDELRPGTD